MLFAVESKDADGSVCWFWLIILFLFWGLGKMLKDINGSHPEIGKAAATGAASWILGMFKR